MATRILGISAYYHDSAACLVEDGRIVAAAQEERFTRKKHDAGFPSRAVDYCLREAGVTVKELDFVGFYEKPLVKFERLLETYVACAPKGLKSYLMAVPIWMTDKLWMTDDIRGELEGYDGKVLFGDHHESHAASAFYPSPFDEAAIVLDLEKVVFDGLDVLRDPVRRQTHDFVLAGIDSEPREICESRIQQAQRMGEA